MACSLTLSRSQLKYDFLREASPDHSGLSAHTGDMGHSWDHGHREEGRQP